MGRRRGNKRKQKNDSINHPRKMPKFEQDQEHNSIVQYQENGMRKIQPYIFKFTSHAKGRWIGKRLLDVFQKEFRFETPLYYKAAIGGGLIRINGKPVKPSTVFRNHDFLQSRVHRHEPPVSSEPLEIIAQDEDFVVINKPSSIPIHPSGKYRHNSITYLMAKEHGLKGLHTFYRLDRLTSGVYIFVKSTERVKKIDSQMRGRELHKVYLSKVRGEFPSEPLECSEPIFAVSHKIGICRVSPEGKPAKTQFQRVSFDGETSIIKCTPFTGRMHQIRVHLQYLGFPVINDPLYTGEVWGPEQGKGGKIPFDNDDEFIAEMTRIHNKEKEASIIQQDCTMLVSKLDADVQDRKEPLVCDAAVGKTPQDLDAEIKNETCVGTSGNSNNSSSPMKQDVVSDNSVGTTANESSSPVKHSVLSESDGVESCESSQKRTKLDDHDVKINLKEKGIAWEEGEDSQSKLFKCTDDSINDVSNASSNRNPSESKLTETVSSTHDKPAIENTTCASSVTNNNERTCARDPNDCTSTTANKNDEIENVPTNSEIMDVNPSIAGEVRTCVKDKTSCTSPKNENSEIENIPSTSSTDCRNPDSSCVEKEKEQQTNQNPAETRDVGTCVDSEEEERLDRLAVELCRECKEPLPDPKPENMMLYLHALSYKGPDFEFSTPLPKWAKEHMERTGSQMP